VSEREKHVIREGASPPDARVWTMWCGAQCIAFDDGTLAPEGFDFYDEPNAEKATCQKCTRLLYGIGLRSKESETRTCKGST
jgi:hypothetical protein